MALIVERLDEFMPGRVERHRLSRTGHRAVLCIRAIEGGHGIGYGICILDFSSGAWMMDNAPALLTWPEGLSGAWIITWSTDLGFSSN